MKLEMEQQLELEIDDDKEWRISPCRFGFSVHSLDKIGHLIAMYMHN